MSHKGINFSTKKAIFGEFIINLVNLAMNIEHNISLKSYNSFGVEAVADSMLFWQGKDDLRYFFQNRASSQSWMVISGGCNILFTKDYNGTLLHPTLELIETIEEDGHSSLLKVGAATDWDHFVGYSVERGLYGAENLSMIPGMVGAAPVQNIGAYGTEVKDIIDSVECYLPLEDRSITLMAKECNFGYRDSIFKRELKGKAIVTAVNFRLSKSLSLNLDYGDLKARTTAMGDISAENIRKAVMEIRGEKLPDHKIIGNGGSFFKNPIVDRAKASALAQKYSDMPSYDTPSGVKIPAGWLIDRAGWKGYRRGDAGVHHNQALVLVNHGSAQGAEILTLAGDIVEDINSKFGILIEPEINIL